MAKDRGRPDLPRSAAGPNSPWLLAFVVSIASFMEVLDTTIANVALRHIAGGLGAGLDESTWVVTSYLVSNAIILPISGWLSNAIGRKRFYMGCVALFTISSLMCGFASSLAMMIVFRILQGLGGGGLAPTEQSIFADSFPPEQRAQAFALYGITVICAPIIGPLLGGWLTDSYSWRWVFLINVPMGILSLVLVYFLVYESDALKKDREKRLKGGLKIDYLGFGLVAIGFGTLQIVLDRFERDDGFSSLMISSFSVIAVLSLVSLVFWELNQKQPAVDVRLFGMRSFLVSCTIMFLVACSLFSTIQLLPQLTQELMNYDATTAGLTLAASGLGTLIAMPIAGQIVGRVVQPKWLIMGGLIVSGFAFLHMSRLSLQMGFWDVALARAYQAATLPFIFVSITSASYIGVPPDKNNEASALINLMRNLGGSVGVSVATTMLAWQTQFHHARLAEHASPYSPMWRDKLAAAEAWFAGQGASALDAASRAAAYMAQQVQMQAQVMSYLDIFWLWAMISLAVWPLAFFIRNLPKGAAASGH